jgi:Ser/Thr protein kinase RdoA (MazF antagonist)
VLHFGQQRFFLQPCLGNAVTHGDRAQMLNAARTLGRLHAAMASFPADLLDRYLPPRPHPSGADVARQHFARAARQMIDSAPRDADRAALQTVRARINAVLDRVAAEDCMVRCLAHESILHGDFQQYNLRYGGPEVVAIVDWDAVRLGPRVLELAGAVVAMLGFDWYDEYARDRIWRTPLAMDRTEVSRFVAAYESTGSPLDTDERAALPGACVLAMAGFICGCYRQPYPTPDALEQPSDVDGCRNVLAWMQHVALHAPARSG